VEKTLVTQSIFTYGLQSLWVDRSKPNTRSSGRGQRRLRLIPRFQAAPLIQAVKKLRLERMGLIANGGK